MSLAASYPKLHQWLSYSGSMLIRPTKNGGVEVLLGDPGGFPTSGSCAQNVDAALTLAEAEAVCRMQMTKQLLQDLLADVPPMMRDQEFICVTGWPPAPNPHFKK